MPARLPGVILAIAVFIPLPRCWAQSQDLKIIRDTTVIDVKQGAAFPHRDILLKGATIDAIRPSVPKNSAKAKVLFTGGYVIPGLWDMHAHLAGVLANPKWSGDVLLPQLLNYGITSVRDMGGDLEALQSWRGEIEAGKRVGPHLYFSGPMLTSGDAQTPDLRTVRTEEDGTKAVDALKEQGADFIKLLHIPRVAYFAVASEAAKQNIDFVGHLPYGVSIAEAAAAGQKSIEHINWSVLALDCSMHPAEIRKELIAALQSNEKGGYDRVLDQAAESFDEANCAAAADAMVRHNTWSVPTLVSEEIVSRLTTTGRNESYLKLLPAELQNDWSPEKLAAGDSAEHRAWLERQRISDLRIARFLHEHGVRMLAGSDSFDVLTLPGPTLHRELQLLVEIGLTPAEALRAATVDAAAFLHQEQSGSVEAGKAADLVVLEADPLADIRNTMRIRGVVMHGSVVAGSAGGRH